jgi:hypothetical protein
MNTATQLRRTLCLGIADAIPNLSWWCRGPWLAVAGDTLVHGCDLLQAYACGIWPLSTFYHDLRWVLTIETEYSSIGQWARI